MNIHFSKSAITRTCQCCKLYVISKIQRNKDVLKLFSISCKNAVIFKNQLFKIWVPPSIFGNWQVRKYVTLLYIKYETVKIFIKLKVFIII